MSDFNANSGVVMEDVRGGGCFETIGARGGRARSLVGRVQGEQVRIFGGRLGGRVLSRGVVSRMPGEAALFEGWVALETSGQAACFQAGEMP